MTIEATPDQNESTDATILGGEAALADEAAAPEAEASAAVEGAPEAYEFTMPEGVSLDTDAVGLFEPVLRELGMSQDAANKLVGTYAEKLLPMMEERAAKEADTAGAELRADWSRQFAADPEIGGAKMEEARSFAAKAMQHFMPNNEEGQRFRTFLNESGLGNHPEMGRFLARVGRGLAEATVDETTGNATDQTSREDRWYGKKKG